MFQDPQTYLPKCFGNLDAKGTENFESTLLRQQLTSSTVAQTRLDAVLARRTKFGVFVPQSSDFQHLTCVGWFLPRNFALFGKDEHVVRLGNPQYDNV